MSKINSLTTDVTLMGKPISSEVLMRATKKPKRCSDVRWRIELKRRAYVAQWGERSRDFLVDPDLIRGQ